MSRVMCIVFSLVLLVFIGCRSANKESTEKPPAAQPPTVQEPTGQPAPQQTPPAAESKPQPSAPAPAIETPPSKESPAPAKESRPQAAKPGSRQAKAPSTKAPVAPAQPVQPPAAPAAATPVAETPAAAKPVEPPAVPKIVEPQYATIPGGTTIQVRLQEPLDSGLNKTGEKFSAILDKDLVVDGKVVAPRGSIVEGKLTKVAQSGRVQGRAAMSLQLTNLMVQNQPYSLQTEVLAFEAESTKKQDAEKVGIGAGVGAIIGAIAGGGKGAAIGAAVGGGAGGATVIATRGKELKFDREHKFSFALRQDVQIKIQ